MSVSEKLICFLRAGEGIVQQIGTESPKGHALFVTETLTGTLPT